MADIKNYLKEKEKRERMQEDYKEKIARHKLTTLYRFLLMAAILAALVILVIIQYKRHVYTDYETISSIPREIGRGTADVRLGDAILSYSKDGAHCTDAMGNVTWNQTFEIQDVKLAFSGNAVAIGEALRGNCYHNAHTGRGCVGSGLCGGSA